METVRDARIKTGVLGLTPAFGSGMHAGTMPRLAGADPSSIAFDDG